MFVREIKIGQDNTQMASAIIHMIKGLCLQQGDQLTLIKSEETGFKEIFREKENFVVGLQKWPQVTQMYLGDYFRLIYF